MLSVGGLLRGTMAERLLAKIPMAMEMILEVLFYTMLFSVFYIHLGYEPFFVNHTRSTPLSDSPLKVYHPRHWSESILFAQ